MSSENDEMYAPGTVNFVESNVPSVDIHLPLKPFDFSVCRNSWALDATWPARTTAAACSETAFCASDVKSVWVAGWDSRSTFTHAFCSTEVISEISGTE